MFNFRKKKERASLAARALESSATSRGTPGGSDRTDSAHGGRRSRPPTDQPAMLGASSTLVGALVGALRAIT